VVALRSASWVSPTTACPPRRLSAIWKPQKRLKEILDEWVRRRKERPLPLRMKPLPPVGTLGFRVQRYGMLQWGDLFTARQKVGLLQLGINVTAKPAFCKSC